MNSEFLFNLHLFHFYSCQKSFSGDSTSGMLKTVILSSYFSFWTKYFLLEPNMFILVDKGRPSCTIWAPQAAIWLERGNCENTLENPRRIFFISTPIYLSLSSRVWIFLRSAEEYNSFQAHKKAQVRQSDFNVNRQFSSCFEIFGIIKRVKKRGCQIRGTNDFPNGHINHQNGFPSNRDFFFSCQWNPSNNWRTWRDAWIPDKHSPNVDFVLFLNMNISIAMLHQVWYIDFRALPICQCLLTENSILLEENFRWIWETWIQNSGNI